MAYKADRRITKATRFLMEFETAKTFKRLKPESKDKVFRAFFIWLEQSRNKSTDYRSLTCDTSDFSEEEIDCLESMTENACDGFDAYWSRCKDRQSSNSTKQSETVPDNVMQSETVPDRAVLSDADNKINNINKEKEINKINNVREEKEESGNTPTLDDVRSYVQEKGHTFDPEVFFNRYESRGWKDVRNWRALADYWQLKEPELRTGRSVSAQQYTQRDYDEKDLEDRLGVNDIFM